MSIPTRAHFNLTTTKANPKMRHGSVPSTENDVPQCEMNRPHRLVPIVVPRFVVVRNRPFTKSGASGAERDTMYWSVVLAKPTTIPKITTMIPANRRLAPTPKSSAYKTISASGPEIIVMAGTVPKVLPANMFPAILVWPYTRSMPLTA